MSKNPFRRRYLALTVINALALLVALYLIRMHFKPDLTEVCNLGEKWNCDIVNKSIYSTLFGVPVAIYGALTYAALLAFSLRGIFRNQNAWIPYVLLGLTGALGFALYLTGIEAFVLHTFCLFCVTQQVLILIEYGIFLTLFKSLKKRPV